MKSAINESDNGELDIEGSLPGGAEKDTSKDDDTCVCQI